MSTDLRRWARDAGERVGTAAGLAAVSVAVAEVGKLPGWWVPVILTGLEAARSWLARRRGDAGSASMQSGDGS